MTMLLAIVTAAFLIGAFAPRITPRWIVALAVWIILMVGFHYLRH